MGGRGRRGKWVMGTEEGTCWDEYWVLYASDESQKSTPKTKSTLNTMYVSQLDNKLYLKKQKKEKRNLASKFLRDLCYP